MVYDFITPMRKRVLTATALTLAACAGTVGTPDGAAVGPSVDVGVEQTTVPGQMIGSDLFSPNCRTPDSVGHFARMLTRNNASEMEGAVFGMSGLIHGNLRRSVATAMTGSSGTLVAGPAFVIRWSDDDEGASVVMSLTSSGPDTRCFVRGTQIRWLDGAGVELGREEQVFLSGSVGVLDVGYTHSCIGPQETGYLISVLPSAAAGTRLFSDVRSVELGLDPGRPYPSAPGSLVPVAYRRCGKSPLFEVAVENRGTEGVAFWNDLVGQYILADEQGPLDWGFLSPRSGLGVIGPGSMMLMGADTFYTGTATRLQAYLAFDDPRLYARHTKNDWLASLLEAERAGRQTLKERLVARAGH
jgi:hypothetical protein